MSIQRLPAFALLACLALWAVSAHAAEAPVSLGQIQHLYVPAQASAAETAAARLLQARLGDLYTVKLEITAGVPDAGTPALLAGGAAVQAGVITAGELEAVKPDGYVLKATGNRIAVAGYAPQGTVYGAWALLRHLGLRVYPWHFGSDQGAAEVRRPLPGGLVQPFTLASKPFFEHRDLLTNYDAGRWGGTLREYTLGDPSRAANRDLFGHDGKKPDYTRYKLDREDWTDWFHTAPYLIPRDLYYETHPEYFAMHDGKRIPPSSYARSQICTTEPDVVRIATERALEWVGLQKDRRVFCIVPADAALCDCPRCQAADPIPDYHADRTLAWVNPIAAAIRERYPDKVVLAAAYTGTEKPPLRVKPEPNVVVMYCPWFWDSRATSEVSFDSPLNIPAMKEWLGWTMRFPGQVGLYDYPGDMAFGAAERIKLYARHGVRVTYFNGAAGSLLHWVGSQLLWDPFLDTEKLVAEYAAAVYGPAADPMKQYLRLQRDATEEHAVHARRIFAPTWPLPGRVPPQTLSRMRDLLLQAAQQADAADEKTRVRILADVRRGLHDYLLATHPATGNADARSNSAAYAGELSAYLRLYRSWVAGCHQLALVKVPGTAEADIRRALAELGLRLPEAVADKAPFPSEALLAWAINSADGQVRESLAARPPVPAPREVSVRFDAAGEAGRWLSDGTQAGLITPAEMATVAAPGGEALRGVRLTAPLSRLPEIPRGNVRIHAGRFYAERVFDQPLDVSGCFALNVHLNASHDVPVTLYVDDLRSDFLLHAGEQILRIDLRNVGASGAFDWRSWKEVRRLAVDIWPQDNYYPYPNARDTQITLFGVTASNQRPAPDRLPHRGRALWLSQFRANVPLGIAVPHEEFDRLVQRQRLRAPDLDYGSKRLHEGFRTFTEHRAVSPIYAILTSPSPARQELAAARELQALLARMSGVSLPINPPGVSAGPDTGNVILLGEAARAAGRVDDLELRSAGPDGFALNAYQGRIAISGSSAEGTAQGVRRYFEELGVRFYQPNAPQAHPAEGGLLHEIYTVESPFFPQRLPAAAARGNGTGSGAATLAEAIKDTARQGKTRVPDAVLAQANRSALTRYIAAKLLWNPFEDATRLIREFPQGAVR